MPQGHFKNAIFHPNGSLIHIFGQFFRCRKKSVSYDQNNPFLNPLIYTSYIMATLISLPIKSLKMKMTK